MGSVSGVVVGVGAGAGTVSVRVCACSETNAGGPEAGGTILSTNTSDSCEDTFCTGSDAKRLTGGRGSGAQYDVDVDVERCFPRVLFAETLVAAIAEVDAA